MERIAQNPMRFHEENGMMVPDGKYYFDRIIGYTSRQIRPAARADVVSQMAAEVFVFFIFFSKGNDGSSNES